MRIPCIAVARIWIAGALTTVAGCCAAQQAYPSRPIHFITPYAAGGSTSVTAHLIGQKLAESLGQPVIVENRPGGNTIIGTEALAKSPPDGYTLMLTTSGHLTTGALLATPYDVIKDFAPVATIVSAEQVLVINPLVPANNLLEFIALAKSKPAQLNYGTPGTGGPSHLAMELFSMLAGIKMQHIPYKGAGQSMTDLIGGQVQSTFSNPINIVAHLKSGKLKALAISGAARSSVLPQLPTFAEAGLPAFEASLWQGVVAPAGTPKGIIEKLSLEIAKILAMPEIKEKMARQGTEPFITSPEQFGALLKADLARYTKVIKAANIKLEE